MKHTIRYLASAVCLAVLSAFNAGAADDLQTESKLAIEAFKKTDSTLATFFENAAGYAVFPWYECSGAATDFRLLCRWGGGDSTVASKC